MDTRSFSACKQASYGASCAMRRDFYRRYDLLLASWYLLSSQAQREIDSIRQDLHEDLGRWRPQQPEPNWGAYAARVDTIRPTSPLR